METGEAIENRRSVREYADDPVSDELLDKLIEAAHWAPSGLNNQPWRFMKIRGGGELAEKLSLMTKYRGVVYGAKALIAVFLDTQEMYDRAKDLMSTGAAIQNILLSAYDRDIGTCWLGEILNQREQVESLLRPPEGCEFVALIAIGYPRERERAGVRHPLDTFIIPPPE
ncbi:MAG: nitroreductase family protein [Actinobacteria bacterium]|nr:nitroreductase family protein [Actinomycetota bacterium]